MKCILLFWEISLLSKPQVNNFQRFSNLLVISWDHGAFVSRISVAMNAINMGKIIYLKKDIALI